MNILIQYTKYFELIKLNSDRHFPAQPTEWPVGGAQLISPSALDVEIWGINTLRILTGHTLIPSLPVKIRITGRKEHSTSTFGTFRIAAEFEFLRDDEPSEFSRGFIYFWV